MHSFLYGASIMTPIADQSFFTSEASAFHNFPAEDQALIRVFLHSIRTSEWTHRIVRMAAVAVLLVLGYYVYSIVNAHPSETIVTVGIGIILMAFIEPLRVDIVGGYEKLIGFLFAEFGYSAAYKNAESGIVAILQRNGYTFASEVRLNTPIGAGYFPACILPYDRDSKRPIYPETIAEMVVDE